MNVFLVYSRQYLETLRTVSASWENQGWKVRLYLPRTQAKPKRGILMDSRVVNFGLKPGQRRIVFTFGKRGWQSAKLVKFPKGNLDEILNCGRSI